MKVCNLVTGVALDAADGKDISIVKKSGKVKALEDEIISRKRSVQIIQCLI